MSQVGHEMKQAMAMKVMMEAKLQEVSAYTMIGNSPMVAVRRDEAHALLDAHMDALERQMKAAVAEADRKSGEGA
jgi:hypothetical protein